jgi:aminoglycoside 3-N-acetyltransferase
MAHDVITKDGLISDLRDLGLSTGDGVFVHASMRSVGPVIGGARSVIEALQDVVGQDGLLGMPGFSADAYFPPEYDATTTLPREAVAAIEHAVPGYDPQRSPTHGMGVIAETFRTWPGTRRSAHPAVSICLNGNEAGVLTAEHSLAWGTGPDTPLGHLRQRDSMKLLLVGVGWNRCSSLHTAETLATHKRTKIRRFKTGAGDAPWKETPDVADDMNRLFPAVGAAFEATGQVRLGSLGRADCRLCDYAALVAFAADWIDAANRRSAARH